LAGGKAGGDKAIGQKKREVRGGKGIPGKAANEGEERFDLGEKPSKPTTL